MTNIKSMLTKALQRHFLTYFIKILYQSCVVLKKVGDFCYISKGTYVHNYIIIIIKSYLLHNL